MPFRLGVPVLTVDLATVHRVDPQNVENLHSMWAVFSHCAASLEEGKRLENFSWRLWNRETFCCSDSASEAEMEPLSLPISSMPSTSRIVNDLQSGSLTPVSSHPAGNFTNVEENLANSHKPFQDSHKSVPVHTSPSRYPVPRHTTPSDLEKMVTDITKKNILRPLPALGSSNAGCPFVPVMKSKASSTGIARHFSPQPIGSSGHFNPPSCSIPTADISAAAPCRNTQPKTRTIFALGGSSEEGSCDLGHSTRTSSQDDLLPNPYSHSYHRQQHKDQTPQQPPPQQPPPQQPPPQQQQQHSHEQNQHQPEPYAQKKKNAIFSFGGSSNEEDVPLSRGPIYAAALNSKPFVRKSQATTSATTTTIASTSTITSFQEVARRTTQDESIEDDVFETDEEEEEIDESAIDDEDDSSDWEDSVEGSGNPSIDEKTLFQRVDSRPNLISRRSLITTMLHQHDRRNALLQAATNSKSASDLHSSQVSTQKMKSAPQQQHNSNKLPLLPLETTVSSPPTTKDLTPITEVPRSEARPIMRHGPSSQQLALSPRTTRRNMLASELTVSLRQHLLWERKQKSQTANAVLKRRHTAQDVAHLKQYPETSFMGKDEAKGSWNDFYEGLLGEYNSRGW